MVEHARKSRPVEFEAAETLIGVEDEIVTTDVVMNDGGELAYLAAVRLRSEANDLRSHARLANLAAADHLDKLLHVAGVGWFVWGGTRFVPDDEDKRVTAAIMSTIRSLAGEALADKDLLDDLKKSSTAGGVGGVARLMSTIEGIRGSIDDLDADPLLLNVANGVLDLRELEGDGGTPVDWRHLTLHPHDPKYRMTQITRAKFDPDTSSLLLDTFLGRSLPDLEVRSYLQRALGAGLLGVQIEHLLPIMEGEGRNGKGVCYGAVHWAVGSYSYVAPSSLFDLTKGDPNRPAPAFLALRGKRLVWVSETAKTVEMDSALIKRLTGGDPITGRLLHKSNSVTFEPSHLLVLVTNSAPRLPADDPAVWARIRRVPWTVVVPPEERDGDLPQKMRGEADAILAWLLAGLADYRAHGLSEPQSVTNATAEYAEAQDTVARFMEDRCDSCDDNDGDGTKTLHIEYGRYCRANGVMKEHVLGEKDFGKRLDSLGHPTKKGTGGRRFRSGLKLALSDEDARSAERVVEALNSRSARSDWCHEGHFGSCNRDTANSSTGTVTGGDPIDWEVPKVEPAFVG